MAYLIIQKKTKWVLVHREYEKHKVLKTRSVALGTPEADGLGVFTGMDTAAAKKALMLHRLDGKARYHLERRARIAERLRQADLASTAWLPAAVVREFERDILPSISKRKERWLLVKDILTKIELPPYEWHWRAQVFWDRVTQKGWSLGYARKLLVFVNAWGEFYCRRTGKAWTPVARPKGADRSKILRHHFEKKGNRPTLELSTDQLKTAEAHLAPEEYNSLKLAFWCGLRKEELDFILANPPSETTWYLDKDRRGFQVFHIFQHKLQRKGIEPRLCWKAVPLVEPEQEALISAIQQVAFKAIPLSKLRQSGAQLTNRSARKGFSVEMELRGYKREGCIDSWLGHIGLTTADKSYTSKRIARYEEPMQWQSRKTKA